MQQKFLIYTSFITIALINLILTTLNIISLVGIYNYMKKILSKTNPFNKKSQSKLYKFVEKHRSLFFREEFNHILFALICPFFSLLIYLSSILLNFFLFKKGDDFFSSLFMCVATVILFFCEVSKQMAIGMKNGQQNGFLTFLKFSFFIFSGYFGAEIPVGVLAAFELLIEPVFNVVDLLSGGLKTDLKLKNEESNEKEIEFFIKPTDFGVSAISQYLLTSTYIFVFYEKYDLMNQKRSQKREKRKKKMKFKKVEKVEEEKLGVGGMVDEKKEEEKKEEEKKEIEEEVEQSEMGESVMSESAMSDSVMGESVMGESVLNEFDKSSEMIDLGVNESPVIDQTLTEVVEEEEEEKIAEEEFNYTVQNVGLSAFYETLRLEMFNVGILLSLAVRYTIVYLILSTGLKVMSNFSLNRISFIAYVAINFPGIEFLATLLCRLAYKLQYFKADRAFVKLKAGNDGVDWLIENEMFCGEFFRPFLLSFLYDYKPCISDRFELLCGR